MPKTKVKDKPAARFFSSGEKVKVAKKTWIVDRERQLEGFKPGEAEPIDEPITGIEGEVCGRPYFSEEKGETMVPLTVGYGGIISVPESRLERVDSTPHRRREPRESGKSGYSKENIEHWREYFRKRGEIKGEGD